MARELRVVTRCAIEFERLDRRVVAVSEDLSTAGVFVRTGDLVPLHSVVALAIELPSGPSLLIRSRVAHVLSEAIARGLGRQPGMGFQFLEFPPGARAAIVGHLESVAATRTPPPPTAGTRVLVAVAGTSFAERLQSSLHRADFEVELAADAAAASLAIERRVPDIFVLSDSLPPRGGLALAAGLLSRPPMAQLPVVLLSDDDSDMARLGAYRVGVRDFIPTPFTAEELTLRLQKIALGPSPFRPGILRGTLADISLATLLSIFDFERKSGVLRLFRGPRSAKIACSRGQVLAVEGALAATPMEGLFELLEWDGGHFEFSACEVDEGEGLGPTQSLLLEHARRSDEAEHADEIPTLEDIAPPAIDDPDSF